MTNFLFLSFLSFISITYTAHGTPKMTALPDWHYGVKTKEGRVNYLIRRYQLETADAKIVLFEKGSRQGTTAIHAWIPKDATVKRHENVQAYLAEEAAKEKGIGKLYESSSEKDKAWLANPRTSYRFNGITFALRNAIPELQPNHWIDGSELSGKGLPRSEEEAEKAGKGMWSAIEQPTEQTNPAQEALKSLDKIRTVSIVPTPDTPKAKSHEEFVGYFAKRGVEMAREIEVSNEVREGDVLVFSLRFNPNDAAIAFAGTLTRVGTGRWALIWKSGEGPVVVTSIEAAINVYILPQPHLPASIGFNEILVYRPRASRRE